MQVFLFNNGSIDNKAATWYNKAHACYMYVRLVGVTSIHAHAQFRHSQQLIRVFQPHGQYGAFEGTGLVKY